MLLFFFSSRRRHTRWTGDWSSDVCSSDLSALFTRRDVIVVASVSCIYGLGSPEEWRDRVLILTVGEEHDRDLALRKLIDSQYVRNDSVLGRGRFRVKGDVVEVQPANSETAYRISFFGDE